MNKFRLGTLGHPCRQREDGAAKYGAVARKLVWSFVLTLVCQSALAQAMYRIKPLGYLGGCKSQTPAATDFNDAGHVTGQACNANGDAHAFVWKNDGKPMVDLGPTEVGSTSVGYAINATGLVAGTAWDGTGQYGFVAVNGTPMVKIRNAFGCTKIDAFDVNNSGQVTGTADNSPVPDISDFYRHAFLWKNDGSPMLDLGSGSNECSIRGATVINDSGQIAGQESDCDRYLSAFIWKNDGSPLSNIGSGTSCCINASGQVAGQTRREGGHGQAFIWKNDGTYSLVLGTFAQSNGGQSGANALNYAGQVAGWAYTKWYGNGHAFVWMNDGTPIKDLGTFGGTTSESNDINASGQVTGWASLTGDSVTHGFLWRNDGANKLDLNTLIDPTDPLKPYVSLTSGLFINKSGNILAEGTDSRTGLLGLYHLQGTVITLAPRALAFGNRPINTTSAAKSVTVTNTSSKAVAITSIALTGTPSNQFAFAHNCGKSLVGYATCAIKVTFKPTSKGAKSAVLSVNGGGGGLRSVTLTGNGT